MFGGRGRDHVIGSPLAGTVVPVEAPVTITKLAEALKFGPRGGALGSFGGDEPYGRNGRGHHGSESMSLGTHGTYGGETTPAATAPEGTSGLSKWTGWPIRAMPRSSGSRSSSTSST